MIRYRPDEPLADAHPAPGPWPVWRGLILAALVLAVLHAEALLGWAEGLPVNGWSDPLVQVIGAWSDTLGRLGLNEPAATLRDIIDTLKQGRA